MRTLLISGFLALSQGALFISCNNTDGKFSQEELNTSIRNDAITDTKEHSEWLKNMLDHERELNSVLFRLGHSERQIADSILAMQDRIYFDTLRPYFNRKELLWYKEYRDEYLIPEEQRPR